ncbi:MAG: AbrB/MazE/SpoVT family DNA-binding domain-containing protein [Acidobacteriia bacterium]|nr:AbrB/MazE/SpoVT family DNA-binding domain-containing protein [Terriglobia bacterium]
MSTTTVSTKGQVVVPSSIRRKLGLQPGDSLEASLEGQRIVLTPRRVRPRKARIIRDPVTGLPVLTAGPKTPKLASAQVREILADFP